ncbi:MAG: hypothetical protein IPO40_13840 [Fibrobacteres bacterium]|nr:hypothetical protein [Fibrobacterota bacterium]
MNHSHHFLTTSFGAPALALPSPLPSVFDYEDYHAFLRDWVAARKARWPAYSLQLLANRAKIKSRSFLRLVCLGQRRLGADVARDVAKAMGLTLDEQERLLELVAKERTGHGTLDAGSVQIPHQRIRASGLTPKSATMSIRLAPVSVIPAGLSEVQFACTLPAALRLEDLSELGERLRGFQAEMEAWIAERAFTSPPPPVPATI